MDSASTLVTLARGQAQTLARLGGGEILSDFQTLMALSLDKEKGKTH